MMSGNAAERIETATYRMPDERRDPAQPLGHPAADAGKDRVTPRAV
jgi:hypothetical protein